MSLFPPLLLIVEVLKNPAASFGRYGGVAGTRKFTTVFIARQNTGFFFSTVSSSRELLALSIDDGLGVLDKVVDEDGPGALLVVVGEVLVDGHGEVEQKVPRVLGDRPVVVLL